MYRFDYTGRAGGGEDLAGHTYIEHAVAHETANRRLMAAAAQGNQCDLVFGLVLCPDDEVVGCQFDLVAMGKNETLQQLTYQIIRFVYEFSR